MVGLAFAGADSHDGASHVGSAHTDSKAASQHAASESKDSKRSEFSRPEKNDQSVHALVQRLTARIKHTGYSNSMQFLARERQRAMKFSGPSTKHAWMKDKIRESTMKLLRPTVTSSSTHPLRQQNAAASIGGPAGAKPKYAGAVLNGSTIKPKH